MNITRNEKHRESLLWFLEVRMVGKRSQNDVDPHHDSSENDGNDVFRFSSLRFLLCLKIQSNHVDQQKANHNLNKCLALNPNLKVII